MTDSAGRHATSQFALTISGAPGQDYIQVSLDAPQFGGSYPGGAHRFNLHFNHPQGPSQVSSGQIVINTNVGGPSTRTARR